MSTDQYTPQDPRGICFATFFAAAQRFLCAAAIRALPSALITRFVTAFEGDAIFLGRPGCVSH